MCVGRYDPGDSSLSIIVTHTQAHKTQVHRVLGNPSRLPSAIRELLIEHRGHTSSIMHTGRKHNATSSCPLLLPPLPKAKMTKTE